MNSEEVSGALPSARAGALRAEPPVASQAEPLVPNAGDFVLFRTYRTTEVACVEKVTPKLVKLRRTNWPRQIDRTKAIAFASNADVAKLLAQSIDGIEGEFQRRKRLADDDHSARVTAARAAADKQIATLLAASGMSAGTAETRSGSGLQPASPVGNAETPKPPSE